MVELTPGALKPGSNGAYIDVQRRGSLDCIEVVQAGHVISRTYEYPHNTPECIVSIMKKFA